MKRFVAYRPAVPTDTHTEWQRNAPDMPQYEGVIFGDGSVAIRWRTAVHSTSIWESLDDLLRIHGHPEYGTYFKWPDGAPEFPRWWLDANGRAHATPQQEGGK